MILTNADVQQGTPDLGQSSCPKHVGFYDRINLDKQCFCLVIKNKSLMTHGNMNVMTEGMLHLNITPKLNVKR